MAPRRGAEVLRFGLVDSQLRHCFNLIRFLPQKWLKFTQTRNHSVNDQAVKENIKAVHKKYHQTNKTGKTKILDSLTLVTERNRKHLIRLLSPTAEELSIAKRSGRKRTYPVDDLLPHIRHLWIEMERVSPGRLKAGLADWLRFYPECPPHLKVQLLRMSISTLGRCLKIIRATETATRGLSTTTPARFMKNNDLTPNKWTPKLCG